MVAISPPSVGSTSVLRRKLKVKVKIKGFDHILVFLSAESRRLQ
jgi:hypothetical protein